MAKTTIASLQERLDASEARVEALAATILNGEKAAVTPQPAPVAPSSSDEDGETVSVATLKRAFYAEAEAIRKMRQMPAKLKKAKAIIRAMMEAGIRAKNESPQDGLHRLGKWTRVGLSEASRLPRGALWNLEGEVAASLEVR